jgi:hypothetical protein
MTIPASRHHRKTCNEDKFILLQDRKLLDTPEGFACIQFSARKYRAAQSLKESPPIVLFRGRSYGHNR